MISREDVVDTAALARLDLSEEEIERLTQELGKITDYVQQLAEVDIEQVKLGGESFNLSNVWREDEVAPSLKPEALLGNAPHAEAGYLRVPKIVE